MAQVVNLMGRGGQCFAESVLGWNRGTIRKGQKEITGCNPQQERLVSVGRPRAEFYLPDLLHHIQSIVEPTGQTDPTFRSTRIYTPLSAQQVHQRLIAQYGYNDTDLPSIRTLRTKLNNLGYRLRKVKKCKPLKKIPETDAIFDTVKMINQAADESDGVLRISLDTKATVKVGSFSRGGYNRQSQHACDHDFQTGVSLTPFGLLLPKSGHNHLWFTENRVTADFMVDRLNEMVPVWKTQEKLHKLVINADNGPECSGHRTQWLSRLVALADDHQIEIQLAYYPPYHSKYNPVERLWGVLENHWRGEIIDSIPKALGLARSMSYRKIKPTVRKVNRVYQRGVTIAKKHMLEIEARLIRKAGLESWFITITPEPQMG
jgi:hypothetical protein